jgi:hypothetical protein
MKTCTFFAAILTLTLVIPGYGQAKAAKFTPNSWGTKTCAGYQDIHPKHDKELCRYLERMNRRGIRVSDCDLNQAGIQFCQYAEVTFGEFFELLVKTRTGTGVAPFLAQPDWPVFHDVNEELRPFAEYAHFHGFTERAPFLYTDGIIIRAKVAYNIGKAMFGYRYEFPEAQGDVFADVGPEEFKRAFSTNSGEMIEFGSDDRDSEHMVDSRKALDVANSIVNDYKATERTSYLAQYIERVASETVGGKSVIDACGTDEYGNELFCPMDSTLRADMVRWLGRAFFQNKR